MLQQSFGVQSAMKTLQFWGKKRQLGKLKRLQTGQSESRYTVCLVVDEKNLIRFD